MTTEMMTIWDLLRYSYLLYMAVAILTALSVVMNNRIPIKTIAWVMVILAIPYLGLLIYFVFGRDHRKRRLINKQSLTQIQKKSLLMHSHSIGGLEIPKRYRRLVSFFKNIADAYPSDKNEIEIISSGKDFFERLIEEIEKAQDHIHVQFYIFMDDETGHKVREALMAKAREGIDIRLLYDDVGCWSTKEEFFEEMRCAGIFVKSFLKVRFPMFSSKLNYRNHRKLVVIDGKTAFIGGINVADRYVTGGEWGRWRDIMLCVRGEAVYGMQTSFLVDWYFADRSLVSGARYYPKIDIAPGPLAQVVASNPIGDWREMLQGMSYAISYTENYLYIQTPYFMPSDYVLTAILNLALAGVDVRIMVPEHSDNKIVELASRSYLGDVVYAGAKVYLYRGGFIHSKMLVCDDALSSVGSANIDFRSFECNFEINTFIYDEGTAKKLKAIFMDDMRNCYQLTYKAYKERTLWQRFKESAARVFSPIL